jgi:MYXO-CTERM domain-containing protein
MDGRSFQCLLALGVVSALVACSGPAGPGSFEGTSSTGEAIVNGTPATAYPEAALVDIYQQGQLVAFCSGSLIAPQVVLTAGHCVMGESGQTPLTPTGWSVTLPYNGNQKITASGAKVFDWPQTDGTVDPNYHDIGLVFLSTPANVTMAQCPALATGPVANGSSVVNIGRIQNGNLSTTALYVGAAVAVSQATAEGYPFDYAAQDIIEQGDSGGPDEVPGSTPHLIVAVNSGGGSDEVLARVDLLNDAGNTWIEQQIAANGGPCAAVTMPDAGSSGSSGSSGGSGSSSGGSGSSSGSSGGSSGSGSGAGVDGGTTGGDGGSTALQEAFGGSSGGCGCRVAGDGTTPRERALALLGLAAVVGATVRRRRQ